MVDRERRNIASKLVGELLAGRITNMEFDSDYPDAGSSDPALRGVYQRLYLYYDDSIVQNVDRESGLTDRDVEMFERCISFLRTDLEYEWPAELFSQSWKAGLSWAVGLRKRARQEDHRLWEAVESMEGIDVWPFRRSNDIPT